MSLFITVLLAAMMVVARSAAAIDCDSQQRGVCASEGCTELQCEETCTNVSGEEVDNYNNIIVS